MPGLTRHSVKKALLIGVQYWSTLKQIDPSWELKGAHEDPKTLRNLLTEVYGYDDENIKILIDDHERQYTWPTRENILAAMHELVRDAQPGDHFVFSFSGHGSQVDNEDGTEDDGFDETLIPVDATFDPETRTFEGYIKDDEIRKILVDALPSGTRCVMIFDCCHSGTASDLPSVFADGFASPCSPLTTFGPRLPWTSSHKSSTDTDQISFQHTSAARADESSAQFGWMRGRHTRTRSNTMPLESPGPDVTSWSACMDSQITYGGRKGGFFIKAFNEALRSNPHQTHAELLQSVRRELAKCTAAHNMKTSNRGASGHISSEPATSPRAQLSSLRQTSYFHTPFAM
ncbi:peptidase C14 [Trametes cingulata]|nr:peptidase C14 [Trametes cingulata]